MAEFFPIVNEKGEVVGMSTRTECHSGSFLLHPVVHLHVFNSKGELYLQKRSLNKDIQPGKWDTSVGGHVDYGETIEQALRREVREELGIIEFIPKFLCSYRYDSLKESELVNTYQTVYDGKITPDPIEIMEGRFWTLEEIKKSLGKMVFTPNFESEFAKLSDLLNV